MARFNLLDSMFGDSQNGPERTLPPVPTSGKGSYRYDPQIEFSSPARGHEPWELRWESWLVIGVTTVLVTFFIVALLRG